MTIPQNYKLHTRDADDIIGLCAMALLRKVLADIPDATYKVAVYLIEHSIYSKLYYHLNWNERTLIN
jgi:hypothetical protein